MIKQETIYKNQSLLLKTKAKGIDLSGATVQKFLYKTPTDKKGEWPATIDGNTLVYQIPANILNETGPWQIHAYVEFGENSVYYGTEFTLQIKQNLKK